MRRKRQLEVQITGGTPVLTPVPVSHLKLVASIIAAILVIAPAPWAFKTYDTDRGSNGTKPVGTHSSVEVLPGTALSSQGGSEQPAVLGTGQSMSVNLGEIAAGSSRTFMDLLRLRNTGETPLTVSVEPVGLSNAPAHTSVAGNRAPGVYFLNPGEEAQVDVGVVVDLVGIPTEIVGTFLFSALDGDLTRQIPGRLAVTSADSGSVINALLGALNTDPAAGFGRIGDEASGLEAAEFLVDGVLDGGAYAEEVVIQWTSKGPLDNVIAKLDGVDVPRTFAVGDDGPHALVLTGKIMNSVEVTKEIHFVIDRTNPEVLMIAPALTLAPMKVASKVTDASQIASVTYEWAKAPKNYTPPAPVNVPSGDSPRSGGGSNQPSPTPQPGVVGGANRSAQEQTSTPTPTSEPTPEPKTEPTPSPTATAAPTPTPTSAPVKVIGSQPAEYNPKTGTWNASCEVLPGTYLLRVVAVDALGNTTHSEWERVEVLASTR